MKSKAIVSVLASALLLVGVSSCGTPAPTNSPTETPTETPTEVPTETPTETPSEVPTETPTETPTEVPTETPTEVPTETPTETPTEAPTGPYIDEPVTISFWNTKGAPYSDVIDNAIKSFKEIEPNITVENVKQSVGISDLQNVVTKGFTSNVYPDIVEGYPDAVSTYLDYEKVVQLDDFMNDPEIGWSEADRADIVPAYLQEGQGYLVDGTYSLPFSKSTEILMYNKILIGVDLSDIDPTINDGRALTDRYLKKLTWDEFFNKLCPALMEYNEAQHDDEKLLNTSLPNYAILGYDSDDNLAITLTQQYGLPYTALDRDNYVGEALFNTPEVADKIEFIKDMAEKKYIMTQGGLGTYTNSLLATQGVLFMIGSTGGLSHCATPGIELGAGYIFSPEEGEGEFKVISQGPSICILDHAADPQRTLRQEAAWLFYKHLTNYKNGLAWALNGGYSPIRYSVMNSEEYQSYVDPENSGAPDSLKHLMATVNQVIAEEDFQNGLYTTPAFKGSAEARTNFGGVISQSVGAVMNGTPVSRAQIEEWLEQAWNNTVLEINK